MIVSRFKLFRSKIETREKMVQTWTEKKTMEGPGTPVDYHVL